MDKIDELEVRKWYEVMKDNHKLVEIRIFDGKYATYSGYFTDIETLLKEIRPFSQKAIYYTINDINEACYSRSQGNIMSKNPKASTKDKDITFRDWLLIDVDPKHDTDNNASDEEKKESHTVAIQVYEFLRDNGFSEPLIIDSGNGYHILYKIEMANNEENTLLVKNFLTMLSLFSNEYASVDLAVFNASRIAKVPGTYSRKGRSTDSRPQRLCKVLSIPNSINITDSGYIKKIADELPIEETPVRSNNYTKTSDFDLDGFIERNGISVQRVVKTDGMTKYVLNECPFDPSHQAPDSAIFKLQNGAIGFKCLHNSCASKVWQDVRLKFEPNAYENKNNYNNQNNYNGRRYTPYTAEERKNLIAQTVDNNKGGIWQDFTEIEDTDRSTIVSIPSGLKAYDAMCCGFDIPSVNVWSGNNGSGKSQYLNQIALNAINAKFKVAMYSGELDAPRLKRWMVFQAAGKSYNEKSSFNSLEYYTPKPIKRKIAEWTKEYLKNYNTRYDSDISIIALEVEKLANKFPLDMLILDNLSSLNIESLGGTTLNQQQKFITKMKELSIKLNIAIHIVVHPRKSSGFLRKDDISGAKTISDLADNVFFIHRWNIDTQKAAEEFLPPAKVSAINFYGATNIIEVIKHREFGQAEGEIFNLFFEPESRRLKNDPFETITYGWKDFNPNPQTELNM